MAILNYTTTVAAIRTAGQIADTLAKHGATSVLVHYEDRRPMGVAFSIVTEYGERSFRLPVNVSGVRDAIEAQWRSGAIPNRYRGHEQAERVAWRIVKDWTEAQLAIIEAGLASLDEVMLPYMVTASGATLATLYANSAGARAAIDAGARS